MRRFIGHIIVFSFFALIFAVLLLWLLGGTGKLRNVTYTLGCADFLYTKSREAETADKVDILFIGSSHAYRTFDPRVFDRYGITTFNLGSSNQSPIQSEVLLRTLTDSLMPRLVVFEVHPDIMSLDGVEAALYQVNNVKPTWHMLPMVMRTRNMKVWCTAVYAMLHNTFSKSLDKFHEKNTADNCYAGRGYVERKVEHFSPSPIPADTITMRKEQLSALRRCTRFLSKKGIPCVLVQVPDTKVQTSAYTNLEEFRTTMSQYGDFHFMQPASLNDSLHYYDLSHLNQDGVELYDMFIYDSLLANILKKKDTIN